MILMIVGGIVRWVASGYCSTVIVRQTIEQPDDHLLMTVGQIMVLSRVVGNVEEPDVLRCGTGSRLVAQLAAQPAARYWYPTAIT